MGIFILCWLGLDTLIFWLLWRYGKRQRVLCESCRYLSLSQVSRWDVCSILGTPATCEECKYFEQWGSNK